jgi:hypothetical protein
VADSPEDPNDGALLSALTTEHFVLQSAASATISESGSRSSLYLLSLSSSLIALGFAQAIENAFAPFAAAVLPTLFLLGCFTVVRLVDTSIQNIRCLRGIARIHAYYAELHPRGPEFFPAGDPALEARAMTGARPSRFSLWFTMASMIGTINAVLGGSMVALFLDGVLGVPMWLALVVAVVVAVAFILLVARYERQRFDAELLPTTN